MNLKKLTVVALAGCGLMIGCNNKTTSTTRVLSYDDAKSWVKLNYSEGKEGEPKYVLPKKAESEWSFCGHMDNWGKAKEMSMTYFYNHMNNFLSNYSYVSSSRVNSTIKSIPSQTDDEFGYQTNTKLTSDIKINDGNFYPALDFNNFDTTIEYLFKGFSKYNASYVVNDSDKTLSIEGSFSFSYYDSQYNGYHTFKMPYCKVGFNKLGVITNINFDFKTSSVCNYVWNSQVTVKWSAAYSWIMLTGSNINIDFIY